MIQNYALLIPLIYIILFIIVITLDRKFRWCIGETLFGLITFIIFIICLVIFICVSIAFITNITNEKVMFVQRQIEYKTITNILQTSKDVVNTDIYLRALDYNSLIAKTQTAIHNPAYSFMARFLKCDWDSLQFIILN